MKTTTSKLFALIVLIIAVALFQLPAVAAEKSGNLPSDLDPLTYSKIFKIVNKYNESEEKDASSTIKSIKEFDKAFRYLEYLAKPNDVRLHIHSDERRLPRGRR